VGWLELGARWIKITALAAEDRGERSKEKRMAGDKVLVCPSCGFKNQLPLSSGHCVSCGASVEEAAPHSVRGQGGLAREKTFDVLWFGIAMVVMMVLTGAIVLGLPAVIPALDFEGSAGMVVAIPVWFVGGLLVGLISPGRTFAEPAMSVLLVAAPTAFILYSGQTVRTMPAFMYALFSALGVLFALIGSYVGERLQMAGE
jgi:cation transport ATPase